MERAIIHSDLTKNEIQPQHLLDHYIELLQNDIKSIFPVSVLESASCPVTGEETVRDSFDIMGLEYQVSQTLGNMYLSPRPSKEKLIEFYRRSSARKFWLNVLWPKTQKVRREKIILPQLKWAHGFVSQYFAEQSLVFTEHLPNHWGYYNSSHEFFKKADYKLIEPLFEANITKIDAKSFYVAEQVKDDSVDCVFLFEALDRSTNPAELLQNVLKSLKPGGLCFITCILSSGFEVQLLGQESEIFVPPERMNLFSFEGMTDLVENANGFDLLEFSTPGVLDISNVVKHLETLSNSEFFKYIFKDREDHEILNSFQDFLQMNRLGTFGRLVLRKQ